MGIPRTIFYRWHDRYMSPGEAGVEDQFSRRDRVWNRIPDAVRRQIAELALDQPELSPRGFAVRFTDTKRYVVSEASVYGLLKARDLVTSPASAVIKASDEFHEKTTRPNQLWQTDFTFLHVIGWGWLYVSTVLNDYSCCIVACSSADDARRRCHIDLGGCLGGLRIRQRDGRLSTATAQRQRIVLYLWRSGSLA